MNKVLGMVCALLLGSFLHAKPLFNEHKTTLLEATETSGTIIDSPDFVVGSSGVILHKFDAKTSIIVSRFDVVSKNASKATLRFAKFEMLSQGAFPDAGVKPVAGDDVIVNYLYNRALIVAPNQTVYSEVTKKYNELTWIHPDVVAAYLTKLFRPNPDKGIFQKACYQNTASLIFFGIKNKGYFVDCHNFNILETIAITETNSEDVQLPFYARVKNIDSSLFSWDSGYIGEYNNYYEYTLKLTDKLSGANDSFSREGLSLKLPFKIVERNDSPWK